ncbi:TonB-dependent receptor [Fulvitalea axinellae]|uniref:TonB-dependent receptor n=1 Tax=Fulvitalea axinellae TaxID=1182444 RepID=A0AAU9CSJ1_9BACT|nr:TonB-dependent receptor [Fulvitalea axinellae]
MRKSASILCLFICLVTFVSADEPFDSEVKHIVAKAEKYFALRPIEKVFLHTDRDYYYRGDSLWFSAYLLNSEDHTVIPGVESLYVELLNQDGSTVSRKILKSMDGYCSGEFKIPFEAKADHYRLVAYTNWMRNYAPEFFFEKSLQLISDENSNVNVKSKVENRKVSVNLSSLADSISLSNKPVKASLYRDGEIITSRSIRTDAKGNFTWDIGKRKFESLDDIELLVEVGVSKKLTERKVIPLKLNSGPEIKFYPEAGDLVYGLKSKVAVLVEDKDGTPAKAEISILDSSEEKIVYFSTSTDGKGTFDLLPQKGKNYYAEIRISGDSLTIPLPAPKSEGYNLTVAPLKKNNISIYASATDGLEKGYLIVHSRNQIHYASTLDLDKGQQALHIRKQDLPEGVNCVTLFDSQLRPRCERLFYVNKESEVAFKATTDKESYGVREKVSLRISATTEDGLPAKARFSISVTDKSVVPSASSLGIRRYLTADSEIGAEMPCVSDFLEDPTRKKLFLIDLKLLTEGWRRFTWQDVFSDSLSAPVFEKEPGIAIRGNVQSHWDKNLENASVILSIDKRPYFANTDTDGNFSFFVENISDTTTVNLIAKKEKGNGRTVLKVNPLRYPQHSASPLMKVSAEIMEKLEDFVQLKDNVVLPEKRFRPMDDTRLLDMVTVTADRLRDEEKKRNIRRGIYRNPSHTVVVTPQKEVEYTNPIDMLRSIPGVKVLPDANDPTILKVNLDRGPSTLGGAAVTRIFIDGTLLDTASVELNFLNPSEISFIDLFKPGHTSIFGSAGFGGAIAIYTKRGQAHKEIEDRSKTKFVSPGFYTAREFASPDYSSKRQDYIVPDHRITLYWNPLIETDDNGNAEVSFFTSDILTDFDVSVQGLSEDGEPVSGDFVLRTKTDQRL